MTERKFSQMRYTRAFRMAIRRHSIVLVSLYYINKYIVMVTMRHGLLRRSRMNFPEQNYHAKLVPSAVNQLNGKLHNNYIVNSLLIRI